MVQTDAPLVARGLAKHFGALHAVEGLDLDVRAGEVFGFLGPNGAGKTTTIRLFLDFLRPTRGTVAVLGGTAGDLRVRRHLGYLPADLHIDPRYTASDLFAFLGHLRGGFNRARLGIRLERFDLDPFRPLRDLSTGNRRKVGIIQAFLHRPELYILDEPSSGLEPCSSTSSSSSSESRWSRAPPSSCLHMCSPKSSGWPTEWGSCDVASWWP